MSQTEPWSLFRHILKAASRPKPGDPKQPTHWPSEASASVTIQKEDGSTQEKVYGNCRRLSFFRYLIDSSAFYSDDHKELSDLVLHLKNNEIPPSDYMRFIWAAGELYEEYIVDQAKNTGVYLYSQVPIYIPAYNVSGKIDLIALDPVENKMTICEAKSVYGHNTKGVVGETGKTFDRPGKPRDRNLMQTAIYHWWTASRDDSYTYSKLLYGARDTGEYSEYLVKTEGEEGEIYYSQIAPRMREWIKVPYTIKDIMVSYQYVATHINENKVPKRDYDLIWDKQGLLNAHLEGELNKSDTEQLMACLSREEENETLVAEGKKPKATLKLPVKGDYQCRYCQFKNTCYDLEGKPRDL